MYIKLNENDKSKTIEEIKVLLQLHAPNCNVLDISTDTFNVNIPYRTDKLEFINYAPLIKGIEYLQNENSIQTFRIVSSNLEQIFNELILSPSNQVHMNGTAHKKEAQKHITPTVQQKKQSEFEVVKILLKKRYLHFKRNYKLILSVLVLPTIFEIIAMGFMTLRPPGEHDVNLRFSRGLYPNSTEFYR